MNVLSHAPSAPSAPSAHPCVDPPAPAAASPIEGAMRLLADGQRAANRGDVVAALHAYDAARRRAAAAHAPALAAEVGRRIDRLALRLRPPAAIEAASAWPAHPAAGLSPATATPSTPASSAPTAGCAACWRAPRRARRRRRRARPPGGGRRPVQRGPAAEEAARPARRRPLAGLGAALAGKRGRFRRHLLGKRVDYSGRAVIVAGPELRLGEVGLPRTLALELCRPFVARWLLARGQRRQPARRQPADHPRRPVVWDGLDAALAGRLVLLNRAPTLHRPSLQAFAPLLVDGHCIRLHPLVCAGFNADFDGDGMAVHLPLSEAAQREARERLWSARQLLSPANGEPLVAPSKDIVLGCYYLTTAEPGAPGEGKAFADAEEAALAYTLGRVGLRARVRVRVPISRRCRRAGARTDGRDDRRTLPVQRGAAAGAALAGRADRRSRWTRRRSSGCWSVAFDDGLPLNACQALVRAIGLARRRSPPPGDADGALATAEAAAEVAASWLSRRWLALAAAGLWPAPAGAGGPLDRPIATAGDDRRRGRREAAAGAASTLALRAPSADGVTWLDNPPIVGPPPRAAPDATAHQRTAGGSAAAGVPGAGLILAIGAGLGWWLDAPYPALALAGALAALWAAARSAGGLAR